MPTSSSLNRSPEPSVGWGAAFRTESYRFQWIADLLTSWAFEMETLILVWYVLIETDSPFFAAAIASLAYLGTLISPMIGVIADRISRKRLLQSLRLGYALLALLIAVLAIGEWLETWHLFIITSLSGLIRPSDLVIRNAIIADTVSSKELTNAMGFSRTTMDSARIVGALVGAGLFAFVGLGVAYLGVTLLYLLSLIVGWGIRSTRGEGGNESAWRELLSGGRYTMDTPAIANIMILAFLVNLFAFPLSHGLLPVMARDVFALDELGLARLVVAYALGALIGSILTALVFRTADPKKLMLINMFAWVILLIFFAQVNHLSVALGVLILVGATQSLSMTSMSVFLIQIAKLKFRGRVLGVRMLAVYGLPLGLLLGGWLIEVLGPETAMSLLSFTGLVAISAAIWYGRQALYDPLRFT